MTPTRPTAEQVIEELYCRLKAVSKCCPRDTDNDGSCGNRHCLFCGDGTRAALDLARKWREEK